MAFDGIMTKAISSELQLLKGARIDKIFQPNSNTIIIGMYANRCNYALEICTNPSNYRINLTTHSKLNPKVAPNFCMVLRKYILGLRIKNIVATSLERVITIELEGFDDIDDIISYKLIIELMGKHCNILLLNDEGIIIDCLKHINNANATHIEIPHIKYTYPKIDKHNFLDIQNFDEFSKIISTDNIDEIPTEISKKINGISKKYISFIIDNLKITSLNQIYDFLNDIIKRTDSFKLNIKFTNNDYFLIPDNNYYDNFHLNFLLDDFYYNKETENNLKTNRNNVLKLILATLKKYNKRLENINKKLTECDNMEKYKLYGELITSNLYKIPNEHLNNISLENYYDNNNLIEIPLNSKYTPSENAKKYFKKYHKLKNALDVVTIQKNDTLRELDYIESIVYELEAATTIEDIAIILDEIYENDIFKENTKKLKQHNNYKITKKNLTKNKKVNFNPIKYNINGFTFLIGRNNKENDYLTLKYAHKKDMWFHTKDIHGSHGILIINDNKPSEDILIKCAELTAYHSKARFSSNVPVDMCEVKYVKKPKGAKPGMVIYTNYKTLYVNPKA